MNETICAGALIIVLIYLLFVHKQESFNIREEDHASTFWKPSIYTDDCGTPIDDLNFKVVPSTQVTIYHRYGCTEFSPFATTFRILRERMSSPQLAFYEEVVDDSIACNDHYPKIVKRFIAETPEVGLLPLYDDIPADGLTAKINSGNLKVAVYDGTSDYADMMDWILAENVDTLDFNSIPDKATGLYPTTNLDASDQIHNYM